MTWSKRFEVNEIKADSWDDAAKFLMEYTDIHRQISLHLTQRTHEFEGNIDEAKTMRDTVATNLSSAISGIKQLSKQLIEVVAKANTVDELLRDTCNQEEYRTLNKGVKLKRRLDKFMREATQAADAAGDNFSDAVIVSAIHAQLEYDSIDQMTDEVKATVSSFEENVNATLDYAKDRDETHSG